MHSAASAPLDTKIRVATPENIAFEYSIAGPFRRLPAYLLDVIVKFAALGLLVFLMAIGLGSVLGELGMAATQVLLLLGLFVTSWFYGAAFETWANGRTVGKWVFGLRVVSTDGHAINGSQALLRNLVMAADMLPPCFVMQAEDFPGIPLPTYLAAMISMALTKRQQRLGDLAAGTMVVVDERAWAFATTKVDDPRAHALASFIPPGFQPSPTLARAIAAYVERRRYLSGPRRAEIARHVAGPLLDQFGFRSDIDPDLLIVALYWRTFWADRHREHRIAPEMAGHTPLRSAAETTDGRELASAAEFAMPVSEISTGRVMPDPSIVLGPPSISAEVDR
jgi:uncharacterized RDD family membrane protein YckC